MATNTNRTNYTEEYLQAKSIYDLRKILRSVGGVPGGKGKGELIAEIMNIQTEHVVPPRSTRGRRPLEMKEFANNFEKRAISENGDEEEEISEQPGRRRTKARHRKRRVFRRRRKAGRYGRRG